MSNPPPVPLSLTLSLLVRDLNPLPPLHRRATLLAYRLNPWLPFLL